MLLAAARRLVALLLAVGGSAVLLALLVGLLAGASANRSISLGLYLSGAFLLLGGFFLGNRGPLRRAGDEAPLRAGRGLRRATPEEMRESVNVSVLLVVLGFVLLALGAAVDSRFELV